jgi:hypothetical protein
MLRLTQRTLPATEKGLVFTVLPSQIVDGEGVVVGVGVVVVVVDVGVVVSVAGVGVVEGVAGVGVVVVVVGVGVES